MKTYDEAIKYLAIMRYIRYLADAEEYCRDDGVTAVAFIFEVPGSEVYADILIEFQNLLDKRSLIG